MADDRPRFSGRIPASGAPLNARTLALRPGGQSFEQGDLTSSDAIANAVYSFLQAHPGLGVPEQGQQNLAETARTVEQNTPWGQGEEAIKSARSGDLTGTVSGIFGAMPIAGAAAGVGAKLGKTAAKDAAETVASTIAETLASRAEPPALPTAIDPTKTGWLFKDVAYPHAQMGPSDWRSVSAATDSGEGVQNVNLPIRSLYATQKEVNPDFSSVLPDPEGRLPFVIRKNGNYYVQDGHHRLTQQAASGSQTAPVRLLDLDQDQQPETPLLDWQGR